MIEYIILDGTHWKKEWKGEYYTYTRLENGYTVEVLTEEEFNNNKTMKFTIYGRIPSKKNSKQIISLRGRPMIISSKDYIRWQREQSKCVIQYRGVLSGREGLKIKCKFYMPDKRATDLSNKFESIADLLVDNKVIDDDNCKILSDEHLLYCGVDKENPRVEIEIV